MTETEAREDSARIIALLTGMIFSQLNGSVQVLTPPTTFLAVQPEGLIRFRLASGRVASVSVDVSAEAELPEAEPETVHAILERLEGPEETA